MTILIIIFAIISAVFSTVLISQDLLIKNIVPDFKKILIPIIIGIIIFILFYNYWDVLALQMVFGIFILICGFLYLDIISLKQKLNHFFIHLLLIMVLAAVGRNTWVLALSGPVIFIIIFYILTYLLQRVFRPGTKDKEEYGQFMELARVLNSIYLLIFGLIFATDRLSFLEKLSKLLF